MARMTKETIHADILANEREIGRWDGPIGNVERVIDPGFGLFDDKPTDGLVDIHYRCTQVTAYHNCRGAIHIATYGPKVIAFGDACLTCGMSNLLHKWLSHDKHDYNPRGEDVLDRSHYELYAD